MTTKTTIYGFTEINQFLCISTKEVEKSRLMTNEDGTVEFNDLGYLDGYWYKTFSEAKKGARAQLNMKIEELNFAKKYLSNLRLADIDRPSDLDDEFDE